MITAIVGKPRSGKTALMTYFAKQYLIGAKADELRRICCEEIRKNDPSGRLLLPQNSPVFTDFPLRVPYKFKKFVESYYTSGFRTGLVNDNVATIKVPFYSKIFLTEVQRYFYSRKFKSFPEWVSRFFEMHGHAFYDIWLDTQRCKLIDINIRDLLKQIIEVVELEIVYDSMGRVIALKWLLNIFDSFEDYENNKNMSSASPQFYNYEKQEIICEENIFAYYDSCTFKNSFLPTSKTFADCKGKALDKLILPNNYNYIPHIFEDTANVNLSLLNDMYSHTAPTGFYS